MKTYKYMDETGAFVLVVEDGKTIAQTRADRVPEGAVIEVYVAPDPLPAWRAGATCAKMQGILALGEARWGQVLAYRDTATWAEKVVIDSATDWHRNSQDIQFFAYLLSLSETDVDDLFRVAAQIER